MHHSSKIARVYSVSGNNTHPDPRKIHGSEVGHWLIRGTRESRFKVSWPGLVNTELAQPGLVLLGCSNQSYMKGACCHAHLVFV